MTSSESELNEMKLRDDIGFQAKKMMKSEDPSDKRFINLFRVREVKLEGSLFGHSKFERTR